MKLSDDLKMQTIDNSKKPNTKLEGIRSTATNFFQELSKGINSINSSLESFNNDMEEYLEDNKEKIECNKRKIEEIENIMLNRNKK
ncbi:TPA: hypothetical protein ACMDU7_000540 [Vibrio parahaemolyticus]|nr:hypothetical protein [Vibrio parahaemolyticus]